MLFCAASSAGETPSGIVAAAILVMLIEEVFDARIVSGLMVRERVRKRFCLSERDSGAA